MGIQELEGVVDGEGEVERKLLINSTGVNLFLIWILFFNREIEKDLF